MLMALVFPVADLRPFTADQLGRSPKPNWSQPDPHEDFLRSIGPLRERLLGGGNEELTEGFFCQADRVFRPLDRARVASDWRVGLVRHFCRIYSDGSALTKLEVGAILGQKAYGKHVWSVRALAQSFLKHQCALVKGEDNGARPLIELGKPFAALYQSSSTLTSYGPQLKAHPDRQLVRAATPIIVTHLNAREPFELPPDAEKLPVGNANGHHLYHSRIKVQGQLIRHWTIVGQRANQEDPTRLLRMYLIRLYTEHQVLRTIFRKVNDLKIADGDEEARGRLQKYVNCATYRISLMAKESTLVAGHEMGTLARVAEDTIRPGDTEKLIKDVESLNLRHEIFYKAKQHIRQDARVAVIVEEGGVLYMTQETHNKNVNYGTQGIVQQAGAQAAQAAQGTQSVGEPKDLASAVAALKDLVAKMAATLPEAEAATVNKAIKNLDAEVNTPGAPPDKGIVLGALEKIGNAADKVKEYVEPVERSSGWCGSSWDSRFFAEVAAGST